MFDDLFSTSKGPGIIGLLLGVFVLAGFCGLGFAVFDSRLNGDKINKQKNELTRNEQQIVNLEERIAANEQKRKDWKGLKKVAGELDGVQVRVGLVQKQRDELKGKVATAEKDIQEVEAAWEVHKEKYRKEARLKFKGRKYAELKTLEGEVYTDVTVKEATPLELSIMDKEGPKRVKIAVLGQDIKDELQWDPGIAKKIQDKINQRAEVAHVADTTGERIRKLRGDIQWRMARIVEHEKLVDAGPGKRRENNDKASEALRRAREFEKLDRADKLAGRAGRNGVRAQAERNKIEAYRAANEKIDDAISEARKEISQYRRENDEAEREIEKLQKERQEAAEKAQKAAEETKKSTTATPEPG